MNITLFLEKTHLPPCLSFPLQGCGVSQYLKEIEVGGGLWVGLLEAEKVLIGSGPEQERTVAVLIKLKTAESNSLLI